MQQPNMSVKQILDGPSLLQKIRRISFQIYENNFEEKEIIIAGVVGEGFALAKMLCEHIQEISKLQAKAVEIQLNKEIVCDLYFWRYCPLCIKIEYSNITDIPKKVEITYSTGKLTKYRLDRIK